MTQTTNECRWEPDEDGTYETDCDRAFTMIDGTPNDNGMKFCCYCGKQLKEDRRGLPI